MSHTLPAAVEAGSYQEFVLTYTAGYFGIDDTGSIKICWRYAADIGTPQFDDPAAPHYVSARTSNGAALALRYDPKDNVRPWGRTVQVKVLNGFLREGDRLEVRYGDRSHGGPGIRMQTFCESTFEFRVLVWSIPSPPTASSRWKAYVRSPSSPVRRCAGARCCRRRARPARRSACWRRRRIAGETPRPRDRSAAASGPAVRCADCLTRSRSAAGSAPFGSKASRSMRPAISRSPSNRSVPLQVLHSAPTPWSSRQAWGGAASGATCMASPRRPSARVRQRNTSASPVSWPAWTSPATRATTFRLPGSSGTTTGGAAGIDCWLADDGGRARVATEPLTCEQDVGELGLQERIIPAGGLGMELGFSRLPEELTACSLDAKVRVPLRSDQDDPIYVRVVQEDGHLAWSSPIYAVRCG